ncbi:MAG: hypothetical protein ABUT39_16955 [Acidobacteriota bacterium]
MASGSSLESQVQESQLREHLGPPIAPPVALGPRPLRHDLGSILLLGAAFGLLITSVRLAISARTLGYFLAYGVTTAALAAGPAAFLVLRRARRGRFSAFERGLVVEIQGRRRTFLLEDLRSFEMKERDGSGGLVRRIALAGPQDARVRFEHFVRHGAEDRLGCALVFLLARLVEVAERRVREGATVAGWDWVLSREGLCAPADDHPIPLDEIGAVTVRQHKVGLWRPAERYPFFVVSDDSANALLLMALLSRRLAERGETL